MIDEPCHPLCTLTVALFDCRSHSTLQSTPPPPSHGASPDAGLLKSRRPAPQHSELHSLLATLDVTARRHRLRLCFAGSFPKARQQRALRSTGGRASGNRQPPAAAARTPSQLQRPQVRISLRRQPHSRRVRSCSPPRKRKQRRRARAVARLARKTLPVHTRCWRRMLLFPQVFYFRK